MGLLSGTTNAMRGFGDSWGLRDTFSGLTQAITTNDERKQLADMQKQMAENPEMMNAQGLQTLSSLAMGANKDALANNYQQQALRLHGVEDERNFQAKERGRIEAERAEYAKIKKTLADLTARKDSILQNIGDPKQREQVEARYNATEQQLSNKLDSLGYAKGYAEEPEGQSFITDRNNRGAIASIIEANAGSELSLNPAMDRALASAVRSGSIEADRALRMMGDNGIDISKKVSDAMLYLNAHNERNPEAPIGLAQAMDIMAKNDVGRVSQIAAAGESGKQSVQDQAQVTENLRTAEQLNNTYVEVLDVLDDPTATLNAVSKYFPVLSSGSAKLQSLRNQLGINVIQSATFGALSEKELDMAMRTGFPQFTSKADAKQHFLEKREAQAKVIAGLEEAQQWLSQNPGKTAADYDVYAREKARREKAQQPAGDLTDDQLLDMYLDG